MMDRSNLPLKGIRVADICVVWAGPYAAWLLSVLGAEVIHVANVFHYPDRARWTDWTTPQAVFEPIGGGRLRIPGERPWNVDAFYSRALWNRVDFSLNLNDPQGIELMLRLIEKSDIFLENNSAHAMESIGIGHEVMLERNPRLICINMPGWGRSGPYKEYVGIGPIHEAIGGEEWLRGYPDEEHPAHNVTRFPMDMAGGMMAAEVAIMGLIYRHRTGRGLWVDFAQMQTIPNLLGEIYMDAAWNKKDQRTVGNRHPMAIQGCYLCRGPQPTLETAYLGGERWINITINNDAEWQALCQVVDEPEWTKDPKFATHESRRAHHDELDQHISEWTRYHDNFELFYLLQEKGVPAGPVEDCRDAYMDIQLNARNFFIPLESEAGIHRYPGFGWLFSKTPLRAYSPPAKLGEHTEYVCKQVIGMSDGEYEDLKAREIVGRLTYPWAPPRPDYEGYARQRGIEL